MIPAVTGLHQVSQDAVTGATVFAWDLVTDADTYAVMVDGLTVAQVPASASPQVTVNAGAGTHTLGVAPVAAATPAATLRFTVPAAGGLKTAVGGMIDRFGVPASPGFDWMAGYVVSSRWDQLQASEGAAITPGNPLDLAIANVRAWNASHSVQRGLRHRLLMSTASTPAWPQLLGGAAVRVTDVQGNSGLVGHYWTSTYQVAYADLQSKLAAEYDAVPEVRENGLSGAALVFPEPYLHYDSAALLGAGDTLAADIASYAAMMNAHLVWKRTLQDLSFNPADFPGEGGITFTLAGISAFRRLFGKQGVLMNMSLRASGLSSDYATMYAAISADGPPIAFQTATVARMGDPATTFAKAVAYGAHSLELPVGYAAWSPSLLAQYQAALLANPA
jgi:hypothetical protein